MFLRKLWDHLEEYIAIILLFLMVIFVFLQVVMRYVFQNSLAWSEELSRYLFVWLVWISASYVAKERRHLKIEVFINLFSNKVRDRIVFATLIVFFLFSIYFSWQGFILLIKLFIAGGLSPAMRIPMFYAYGAVPIGSGLMAIRLFEEIKEVVIYKSLD
jgi:TRAP-type C4-dicarboxylate transport system permease small subunit